MLKYLGIAQQVERVFWEHEVAGSRPVAQTSQERLSVIRTALLGLTA